MRDMRRKEAFQDLRNEKKRELCAESSPPFLWAGGGG